MIGAFPDDSRIDDVTILTNSGGKVTSHDCDVMVRNIFNSILQLIIEVCLILSGGCLGASAGLPSRYATIILSDTFAKVRRC